jgi:2-octaprenyl-6-methoxyphenol hydroxylase
VVELPEVDVAVVGGGPVGCAFALALAENSVSVVRVASGVGAADRPIAVSHGSRLILERLGVWKKIVNTPIETIHVSQQGFGRTIIRSTEHGLPALGYVTAYSDVVGGLAEQADRPIAGTLRDWEASEDSVVLRLSCGTEELGLRARLLVLADGGTNRAAQRVKEYPQQAIVADVTVERSRRGVAWERFTPEGPLALLPHGDHYALVWSVCPATGAALLRLSDPDFLARLRKAFGGRLGDFRTVGPRSAFPLSLRRGSCDPAPRVIAVGNAAQTLHPVAGQGFNLGLRDAWELAQMLLDVGHAEIGTRRFIARYLHQRNVDRYAGIRATDFLVRIFSNSLPPLAAARGAGLALLDALPPARNFLARRMIFGARGLP